MSIHNIPQDSDIGNCTIIFKSLFAWKRCCSKVYFLMRYYLKKCFLQYWIWQMLTGGGKCSLYLRDTFPKRNVKKMKVNLEISRSVLFKLLITVHLSLRNKGHWRRKWKENSTPLPLLQCRFNLSWKKRLNLFMFLQNYDKLPVAKCFRRWPSEFYNARMEQAISFTTSVLLGQDYSIILYRRVNESLSKLCLLLKREIAYIISSYIWRDFFGIVLYR